ncbi:MAG TPA: hypothetical protein VFE62_26240 [Gemmataceae bacterium]|nr:hypothetical protein [Gemmataceae bacterium]
MTEKKPAVIMTASGRVKEFGAGTDIREILETVSNEQQTAGSNWDRPTKLFIGGECVVDKGLTDIAWDYGKFWRAKEDELYEALDQWIQRGFITRMAYDACRSRSGRDGRTRALLSLRAGYRAFCGGILHARLHV